MYSDLVFILVILIIIYSLYSKKIKESHGLPLLIVANIIYFYYKGVYSKEHFGQRSSLSKFYPPQGLEQRKDICGQCDGICKDDTHLKFNRDYLRQDKIENAPSIELKYQKSRKYKISLTEGNPPQIQIGNTKLNITESNDSNRIFIMYIPTAELLSWNGNPNSFNSYSMWFDVNECGATKQIERFVASIPNNSYVLANSFGAISALRSKGINSLFGYNFPQGFDDKYGYVSLSFVTDIKHHEYELLQESTGNASNKGAVSKIINIRGGVKGNNFLKDKGNIIEQFSFRKFPVEPSQKFIDSPFVYIVPFVSNNAFASMFCELFQIGQDLFSEMMGLTRRGNRGHLVKSIQNSIKKIEITLATMKVLSFENQNMNSVVYTMPISHIFDHPQVLAKTPSNLGDIKNKIDYANKKVKDLANKVGSTTIVLEDNFPQKWVFEKATPGNTFGYVYIRSYEEPNFYLECDREGNVRTNPVSKKIEQQWILTSETTSSHSGFPLTVITIKSAAFDGYLSHSQQGGYLNKYKGNVFMTNSPYKWFVMTTNVSYPTKPVASSTDYTGFGSPSDFPTNAGGNKSHWLPQFANIWNGKYAMGSGGDPSIFGGRYPVNVNTYQFLTINMQQNYSGKGNVVINGQSGMLANLIKGSSWFNTGNRITVPVKEAGSNILVSDPDVKSDTILYVEMLNADLSKSVTVINPTQPINIKVTFSNKNTGKYVNLCGNGYCSKVVDYSGKLIGRDYLSASSIPQPLSE